MEERCDFEGCKKPAQYTILFHIYNQYGKKINDEDELVSCSDHLIELANSASRSPTGVCDIEGKVESPDLLEKITVNRRT